VCKTHQWLIKNTWFVNSITPFRS